ncbi:MAG TPA: hypothetical protein DCX07_03990 [Phycisphaerales bacterium]|nr:hypothetical protein [Phycisphaerales bacterium]
MPRLPGELRWKRLRQRRDHAVPQQRAGEQPDDSLPGQGPGRGRARRAGGRVVRFGRAGRRAGRQARDGLPHRLPRARRILRHLRDGRDARSAVGARAAPGRLPRRPVVRPAREGAPRRKRLGARRRGLLPQLRPEGLARARRRGRQPGAGRFRAVRLGRRRRQRDQVFLVGRRQLPGPAAGARDDVLGFGVAQGGLSERAGHSASHETAREMFYNLQVTPWFQIGPSVQYVFNPGGDRTAGDAVVTGLRALIRF